MVPHVPMVAVLVAWISVGNTPLLDLSALAPDLPKGVRVLGKAEFSNPSGSVKDRIVEYILDEQERIGRLTRFSGQTIVASSSGNTATSLAMFSALRGYRCIAITNRGTSKEKVQQLYAYGAEVVVTASGVPTDSPVHYQNVEKQLVEENPGYFGLNQYDSPLNPEAYYATLGPELWAQTNGKITHLVAAGSTGGTVSGTARFLKKNFTIQAPLTADWLGLALQMAQQATAPYGSSKRPAYSSGRSSPSQSSPGSGSSSFARALAPRRRRFRAAVAPAPSPPPSRPEPYHPARTRNED